MTSEWLHLTADQLAELAALSAANAGPNFISPVFDIDGRALVNADVLTDSETFAHYQPLLTQTFERVENPTFPQQEE